MRNVTRACKGKIAYPGKLQANAAAASMRRRLQGRYHAYKCKFCGNYHVGHKGASKRRRW